MPKIYIIVETGGGYTFSRIMGAYPTLKSANKAKREFENSGRYRGCYQVKSTTIKGEAE